MVGKTTAERVNRGGTDPERLYLKNDEFIASDGQLVHVEATNIPGIDMADLIARHRGRYYLVGLFCRPGYGVLDFPCGSGYGAEVLRELGVHYEGRDRDEASIEYARRQYGGGQVHFLTGDLCAPDLDERYEVVACIEGLEHIEMKYQDDLIAALRGALNRDGVLVVSSPENPSGISGKSEHNAYHLGELTRTDFVALLHRHFSLGSVELVTYRARLSTGVVTTCFFGICHGEGT